MLFAIIMGQEPENIMGVRKSDNVEDVVVNSCVWLYSSLLILVFSCVYPLLCLFVLCFSCKFKTCDGCVSIHRPFQISISFFFFFFSSLYLNTVLFCIFMSCISPLELLCIRNPVITRRGVINVFWPFSTYYCIFLVYCLLLFTSPEPT